ncbi:MAG: YtxH domain-containing protein [Bacteroidetes bacterium]|nr:YtxH domain-containing protein [Bacteroidota bacterium]
MNDKTKIMGALVLGAIAGVAIVKLLESDKGKEFVESAKEKAQSTADDIKAKIHQLETELSELLQMQKEYNSGNQA